MAVVVGDRILVTWLTPYWDLWEQQCGAIAPGRLAKALAAPHAMLGPDDCVAAFHAYVCEPSARKAPEYFAKECRLWLSRAIEALEPVVSPTGALTAYGRKIYGG